VGRDGALEPQPKLVAHHHEFVVVISDRVDQGGSD
jgi:hypothetical protein